MSRGVEGNGDKYPDLTGAVFSLQGWKDLLLLADVPEPGQHLHACTPTLHLRGLMLERSIRSDFSGYPLLLQFPGQDDDTGLQTTSAGIFACLVI